MKAWSSPLKWFFFFYHYTLSENTTVTKKLVTVVNNLIYFFFYFYSIKSYTAQCCPHLKSVPYTIKTGLAHQPSEKYRGLTFFSLSSSPPLLFIYPPPNFTQLTLWCELPHCFFSLENQSRVEYWVSKRQFLIPESIFFSRKWSLGVSLLLLQVAFIFAGDVWLKLFLNKHRHVDNFKRKFSEP